MFVSAFRLPCCLGLAVFRNPGMERVDVDAQLISDCGDRLAGYVRQFNRWRPEFRCIGVWLFAINSKDDGVD